MAAFLFNALAKPGAQQRVYLDESGTLGYSGELFTMALVLVRDLPKLEACTLKNRVTQSEVKASQMKTAQKLALARTLLDENDIEVFLAQLDPFAAMVSERKLDKEFLYDSMVAQALAFYLERGDLARGLPYRVSMDMRGGLRESYEDMVGESVATVLMHREVPLVSALDVRFLDSRYSAGVQAADLFSNIYRTSLTQTDSPCTSFLRKYEEDGRVHAGFAFGLPELADQMSQIAADLRAHVEAQRASLPGDADAGVDGAAGERGPADASAPAGVSGTTVSADAVDGDGATAISETGDRATGSEVEDGVEAAAPGTPMGTSRSARRRRSRAARRDRATAEQERRAQEGAGDDAPTEHATDTGGADSMEAATVTAETSVADAAIAEPAGVTASAGVAVPSAAAVDKVGHADTDDTSVESAASAGADASVIASDTVSGSAGSAPASDAPTAPKRLPFAPVRDVRPGRSSRMRQSLAAQKRAERLAARTDAAPAFPEHPAPAAANPDANAPTAPAPAAQAEPLAEPDAAEKKAPVAETGELNASTASETPKAKRTRRGSSSKRSSRAAAPAAVPSDATDATGTVPNAPKAPDTPAAPVASDAPTSSVAPTAPAAKPRRSSRRTTPATTDATNATGPIETDAAAITHTSANEPAVQTSAAPSSTDRSASPNKVVDQPADTPGDAPAGKAPEKPEKPAKPSTRRGRRSSAKAKQQSSESAPADQTPAPADKVQPSASDSASAAR